MPAALVPHADIPSLAAKVTPEMQRVLRRVQKGDYIHNGKEMDRGTAEILAQLSKVGLVDPGYDGDTNGPPYMWVANSNGSRVLMYLTGIRSGPHYEINSAELAAWLELQGPERWWNVDGDPLLTGRLTFPCPAKTLAMELRKIARPLLIQAKKEDITAQGQTIGTDRVNAVVDRLGNNIQLNSGLEIPAYLGDRILYLCWKGATDEWLLAEDSETTSLMSAKGDRRVDAAVVEKK